MTDDFCAFSRHFSENAELSERSAKLMRGIAKGAQDYESRIAALEEKQRALEAEKAAVEVDRERAARRVHLFCLFILFC